MGSNRDLGPLGENTLRMWCNQVGITPQKAETDRHGWDFILEFPPELSTLPYDRHPAPIKCWIQVKSTDTPKGNRDVELSNWQHLVNVSYPAFFLALEFDSQNDCQRAYLIHIGDESIYKVLKRLREKNKNGQTRLNKLTMKFNYSADDMLHELSGLCLKQMIEKHIPKGIDNYINWKSDYKRDAGYEQGASKVDIFLPIPENLRGRDFDDVITDVQLGRIPPLEFGPGEVFDIRFGIPIPMPEHRIVSGEIFEGGLPSPKKVSWVFSSKDDSTRISIEGSYRLIVSHEGKFAKSNFQSNFITIWDDIDLKPSSERTHENRMQIKLSCPENTVEYSLVQLHEYAILIHLINEIITKKQLMHLRQHILIGEKPVFDSKILSYQNFKDFGLSQNEIGKAALIRCAYDIAQSFDLHNEITLSVPRLIEIRTQLSWFKNLIDIKNVLVGFSFHEANYPPNPDSIRFVQPLSLVLGNYKFILVYSAFGKWRMGSGEVKGQKMYQLETDNVTVEKKWVVYSQDPLPFDLEQLQKEMIQKYPEDTINILPLLE